MPRDVSAGNVVLGLKGDARSFVQANTAADQALRRQQRRVNQARRTIRRYNRQVQSTVRGMLSLRNAFLSLVGGGGLAALIKQSADFGAALREQSIALGINVEQLQLYRRVLQGEGLSTQQFDRAIATLNRRINEGAQGVAEYADIFERLGVATTDSNGNIRDTEVVLNELLVALNGVASDTERSALAVELFGTRAQAAFLNVAASGQALDQLAEGQRAFGVVSEENAAILKALAQTFTDTGEVIRTAFANIVAENAEGITGMVETFQRVLVPALRTLVDAFLFAVDNINLFIAALATGPVIRAAAAMGRYAASLFLVARGGTLATNALRLLRLTMRAISRIGVFALLSVGAELLADAIETANVAGLSLSETLLYLSTRVAGNLIGAFRAVQEVFAILFEEIATNFERLLSGDFGSIGIQTTFEEFGARVGLAFNQGFGEAIELFDAEELFAQIEEARRLLEEGGEGLELPEIPAPELLPPEVALPDHSELEAQLRAMQNLLDLQRQIEDARVRGLRAITNQTDSIGLQGGELAALAFRQQQLDGLDFQRERLIRAQEDAQRELNAAQVAGVTDLAQYRQALLVATLDLENFTGSYEQLVEDINAGAAEIAIATEVQEQAQQVQGFLDSAKESFGSFTRDILQGNASIGDSFRNLVRTITDQVLELALVQPIVDLFGTSIGNLLGGSGGGFGGFNFGSLFGGFFQAGGRPPVGIPSIVGEGGPELFVPDVAGTIVPNGSFGGNTVNLTYNISRLDGPTARQAILETAPDIERSVRAGLTADASRPSTFRTSVRAGV